MTQVLGGYLSDKMGGDTVLALTAAAWSLLTFWTPFFVNYYPDRDSLLAVIVLTRVLMGCLQGINFRN